MAGDAAMRREARTGCVGEVLSPEKQRQILAGAATVFAQDGYEGASMARIAAEAGVSKGTLYNYFDGKAELFRAYVEERCDADLMAMFAEPDPEAPIETVLHGFGMRIIDTLLSEPALVIYRIVISEAPRFPALARAFYEGGPDRLMTMMTRWLAGEVAHGRLQTDNPELAVHQFFTLCQAKFLMQRRLQLVHTVAQAERDLVVAAAVTMFLRSYGPVR